MTQSFSFLHAADLHLDTPFRGIGSISMEVGTALQDASLNAWDRLVAAAIERRVAFVLLAGDLYDGAERGLRAQLRVLAGLRRLSDEGIDVIIVHGNHDPLSGWSAITEWPPSTVICAHGDVTTHVVKRDGIPLATIHGISYAQQRTEENLALRFPPKKTKGFHVGVLHTAVGSGDEHGSYAPCSLDDLRQPSYDYWALEHLHAHQVLSEHPYVVYSGSLQGRSAKASELGAKGAVLVSVVGDEVAGIEHLALDCIRFVALRPDVGNTTSLVDLQQLLAELGRAVLHEHRSCSVVLHVTLCGQSLIHAELGRPGAREDLLLNLREGADTAAPFLWWSALEDRTSGVIDRDSIRAQDGFAGALVRHVDELERGDAETSAAVQLQAGWLEQLASRLQEDFPPKLDEDLRAGEMLALRLLGAGS